VNGDGADDLVVVNSNSHTLGILYGNGDGTFQDAVTLDFPSPNVAESVALVDLNGDHKLDLVTGNLNGTYGDASVVSVLLNDGNDADGHALFRHGPGDDYPTGMDVHSLVAGSDFPMVSDFNGDGIPDVIFASDNGHAVGVLLGNGDGTLKRPPLLSPTYFFSGGFSQLAIADFDDDGKLDVTVPAYGVQEAVLYGNGDGTFGPPTYYDMREGAWAVAVGDFNGDGAPDLAVAVYDGTVAILLNTDARFPSPPTGGPSTRGMAALPDLGVADGVAFRGTQGAGTLAGLPPLSPASDEGSAASGVPAIVPVDRFFAVLDQEAIGLPISRWRLRSVRWLDEVAQWEAVIEDDPGADVITYHHGT
jgi:hypothetical protein